MRAFVDTRFFTKEQKDWVLEGGNPCWGPELLTDILAKGYLCEYTLMDAEHRTTPQECLKAQRGPHSRLVSHSSGLVHFDVKIPDGLQRAGDFVQPRQGLGEFFFGSECEGAQVSGVWFGAPYPANQPDQKVIDDQVQTDYALLEASLCLPPYDDLLGEGDRVVGELFDVERFPTGDSTKPTQASHKRGGSTGGQKGKRRRHSA